MDIVIIVLLIGLSITLGIGLIYTNNQVKNFKDKMTQNEKEKSYFKRFSEEQELKIKDLVGALENESVARKFAELEANLVAEEKSKLEEKLESKSEELFQLQTSIQVEAVKNDSAEDLDDQLAQLRGLIDAKNAELVKLTESSNLTTAAINEKLLRLEELDASIRALEGRICSDEKRVEEIKGVLEVLNHDLDDLTNLKASVLKVEEGAGNV